MFIDRKSFLFVHVCMSEELILSEEKTTEEEKAKIIEGKF